MSEMKLELAQLITKSLGGVEGEINGRVAEAVNHLEEGAGLKKLRDEFSNETVRPWYKCWWKLCLWLMFIGSVFGLYFTGTTHLKSLVSIADSGWFNTTASKYIGKSEATLFNDDEKFFLNGDPYELWMSDKMNKGYAAEYVFSHDLRYGDFPDDLLEIGAKADPNNSWYLYMEAASLTDKAVKKVKRDKKESRANGKSETKCKYRGINEYEILDQASYEEVLNLLEKADSMEGPRQERFTLLKDRLKLYTDKLKPDFLSKVLLISISAGHSYDGMKYLKVFSIMDSKFCELAEKGDREEVKKWIGIHERFVGAILDDDNGLIEMLIAKAGLSLNLAAMKEAAERVGLVDEAAKFEECISKLESDDVLLDEIRNNSILPEEGKLGILGQLMFSNQMSLEGSMVDASEYEWERYGDHAFLTKWLSIVMSVLLSLLLLIMSIYQLFKGKLVRVLGRRVVSGLNLKDSMIIVSIGIITPIIFYYIVNQYSPLSVRKWNIAAGEFVSVTYQFGSMVLLVLWASYMSLRWRLSVKLEGVVRGNGIMEWLAGGSAFSVMLLIGFCGYDFEWLHLVCFVLLAYSLIYFLIRGIKGLVDNKELVAVSAIHNGMCSLLAVFIITMTTLIPFYYAQEQWYISNDTLFSLDPEKYCEYEQLYRVSESKRRVLKKYLDIIR